MGGMSAKFCRYIKHGQKSGFMKIHIHCTSNLSLIFEEILIKRFISSYDLVSGLQSILWTNIYNLCLFQLIIVDHVSYVCCRHADTSLYLCTVWSFMLWELEGQGVQDVIMEDCILTSTLKKNRGVGGGFIYDIELEMEPILGHFWVSTWMEVCVSVANIIGPYHNHRYCFFKLHVTSFQKHYESKIICTINTPLWCLNGNEITRQMSQSVNRIS